MTGSDSDRVERLKERLARPKRTRETAIDIAAVSIAARSRGLQRRITVAADEKRDLEARIEALMETYGKVVGRASK